MRKNLLHQTRPSTRSRAQKCSVILWLCFLGACAFFPRPLADVLRLLHQFLPHTALGGFAGRKLSKGLLEWVGSRAVVGYTQDVDWMKSMLIDLLFTEKFYSTAEPWADGELRRIYDEVIDEVSFAERLGFTIVLPS